MLTLVIALADRWTGKMGEYTYIIAMLLDVLLIEAFIELFQFGVQ